MTTVEPPSSDGGATVFRQWIHRLQAVELGLAGTALPYCSLRLSACREQDDAGPDAVDIVKQLPEPLARDAGRVAACAALLREASPRLSNLFE